MTHRPTTLSLAARHCMRAVDFYEAGTPYDRSVFDTGIAAHAVLQAVGEETNRADCQLPLPKAQKIGQRVVHMLIATGRSFEGEPEPPLNADRVWRGYEAALDYLARQPLEPGGQYEVGLAVDRDWRPAVYGGHGHWLGHIVDRLDWNEEGSLLVIDYKGWQDLGDELDSLQSKVAVLVAFAYYGSEAPSAIRRIVSYRRGTQADRQVWWSDYDRERLAEWRAEVEATCAAVDEAKVRGKGKRPASPGAGCVGCPYLAKCDDAQDYRERAGVILDHGSAGEQAKAYAVAVADVGRLREALKPLTLDDPIEVDGFRVGLLPQPLRTVKADSVSAILDEWEAGEVAGDLRGFVQATGGLGVGQLESLAKVLYEKPDQRREWVAAHTETVTARGVFRAEKT